jgi:hypothetical protein
MVLHLAKEEHKETLTKDRSVYDNQTRRPQLETKH